MKISPIIYPEQTSFKSSERTRYYNKATGEYLRPYYSVFEDYISFMDGINPNYNCVRIVNSNKTNFFRGDITGYFGAGWNEFAKYLDEEFKGKVNVYDFGCSDGSEAYSLIISLIENLGEENAKRFLPVYAYDIDPYIIRSARTGKIKCDGDDMKKINEHTNNNPDKYFTVLAHNKKTDTYTLEVKPVLKDNVIFNTGDISRKIEDVEGSNSLILCRNFWRYMSQEQIFQTVKKMKDTLDFSSRITIGDFDMYNEGLCAIPDFFEAAGFYSPKFNIIAKEKDPKILSRFKNDEEYLQYLYNRCYYNEDD